MGKKVEENGARRRQRRSFTPEFKEEPARKRAIRRTAGKTVA